MTTLFALVLNAPHCLQASIVTTLLSLLLAAFGFLAAGAAFFLLAGAAFFFAGDAFLFAGDAADLLEERVVRAMVNEK